MRLPGCLAIELGVAAILLGGTGVAGYAGARELGRRWDPVAARAWLHGVLRREGSPAGGRPGAPQSDPSASSANSVGSLAARQDLSADRPLPVAMDTPGTFLGMSDDLLIERLRNQPISQLKLNRGGSSLSFRAQLADGSRAAWKPTQTNLQTIPRKEVAAYRLNRLLGLNAVPPSVLRAMPSDDLYARLHPDSVAAIPRIRAEIIVGPGGRIGGAASYWIPVIKDSGLDTPEGRAETGLWLTQGQTIPFSRRAMAAQVSTMVVFDFLIANPDRYSGGNMKMSEDGTQLFFMDNTMSFYLDPDGFERARELLLRTQRFSRVLSDRLRRVELPTLRRLMRDEADGAEILTEAEMRAVVARREIAEAHITSMVQQYGASNVLCFP